jgi:hypothetical protein
LSVRARISSTWGTFGTACTIGFVCNPAICGVPSTNLRNTDCGKLNFNFTTGFVVANTVAGATLYEFEITDLTTSSIVSIQSRTTVNLYFNSISPTLQSNKQYSIRVRATISGVTGTFGSSCNIGFASGSRENEMDNKTSLMLDNDYKLFKILLYPNPFLNEAKYIIQSTSQDKIEVQIIDIFGQIVMNKIVNSNEYLTIGNDLAKGNYIMKAANRHGEQVLFKMMKVN